MAEGFGYSSIPHIRNNVFNFRSDVSYKMRYKLQIRVKFLPVFIRKITQTVANVLTGRNSAQCRVGRANYNEIKTIRKAIYFIVTREFHALQRSSDSSE